MKTILLFGAGKSATSLIDYLIENAGIEKWEIIIADADLQLAQSKAGDYSFTKAVSFDIKDEKERIKYIKQSQLVISMLPAALHNTVAKDCIRFKRHLLTASYADEEMRTLSPEIENNSLIFLCEMGLDPGIDHMSAMKIIDTVHKEGGSITSFKSHCGGLVAPESDDNPWHYKISWNARNVVTAGKSGAIFLEDGQEKKIEYADLFTTEKFVDIPGTGLFCWYPNRDSLHYISLYGLKDIKTFIRTTLRHPDFMYGWKNIIDLKLTDDLPLYETRGKSLHDIFKIHMDKNGFGDWLKSKMNERFAETRNMLESLMKLMEAENVAQEEGVKMPESFMTADEKGNLEEIGIHDVKNRGAAYLAHKMREANLTLKQLFFLGLDDTETKLNKGLCSPADILQFSLEKKLALRPYDKDMIIMLHEIEYKIPGEKENNRKITSRLVVTGENSLRTAMAKTVGLPLGIAAKLILNGKIRTTGLQIPTSKEIYEPVLQELEKFGIQFLDSTSMF